MVIKFDRMQISSINNIQSSNVNKSKAGSGAVRKSVPEKDTFDYVLENAKNGNEMAAVLIDEWCKTCKPKDEKEKQVYNMINKAVNKIFK